MQQARQEELIPKSEFVREQELAANSGVEFYKITRKAKEMSAIDAQDDDDDDEDSEAALIRKFQAEQQDKLWLSDKVRDR